jgi:hypothetical protein
MYGFCRDSDPCYPAVDDRPDFLYVGLEFSFTCAGDFSADPAEIFGLASPGNGPAGYGFFACEVTYSCHLFTPDLAVSINKNAESIKSRRRICKDKILYTHNMYFGLK